MPRAADLARAAASLRALVEHSHESQGVPDDEKQASERLRDRLALAASILEAVARR